MSYPMGTESLGVSIIKPPSEVLSGSVGEEIYVFVEPQVTADGLHIVRRHGATYNSDLPGSTRGVNGSMEIKVLMDGTQTPVMVYASKVKGLHVEPEFCQFY